LPATLILDGPDATDSLARAIAPRLRPSDVVGLVGGLGAGKSHFARSLILSRLNEAGRDEEVPSPSFTLVQTYEAGGVDIWHADLYRLGSMDEIGELGLEDAFGRAICIVEWADRLGSAAPSRMLTLTLDFDGDDDARRVATIEARGSGWDWLPETVRRVAE